MRRYAKQEFLPASIMIPDEYRDVGHCAKSTDENFNVAQYALDLSFAATQGQYVSDEN